MNDERKRVTFDLTIWIVSLAAGLALVAQAAMAGPKSVPVQNELWQAECGSCHIAYPPKLLSAPAWRRVMSGLEKHFGTDASVDPAAAARIGAFLEQEAGRGPRLREPAQIIRITETRWFVREHDEVPPATWKIPSVKSPANCAACHTAAAQGDFGERNIRIPR